ncbi:MAG TPA: hypothetical protein VGQ83_14610 [Polyangia bacterium]|jgi:hypothetical protein
MVRVAAVVAAFLAALVATGGCRSVHDLVLVLREAPDAAGQVAEPGLDATVLALLDCSARPTAITALCVETYVLGGAGVTTMQAACHDAPQVQTAPDEPDLAAYLRGLGPLADGLTPEPADRIFVRLLGYADAGRRDLRLCGISPAIPGGLDPGAWPAEWPIYLLCQPAAPAAQTAADAAAAQAFDDYCAGSDFVSLF